MSMIEFNEVAPLLDDQEHKLVWDISELLLRSNQKEYRRFLHGSDQRSKIPYVAALTTELLSNFATDDDIKRIWRPTLQMLDGVRKAHIDVVALFKRVGTPVSDEDAISMLNDDLVDVAKQLTLMLKQPIKARHLRYDV